MSCNAECLQYVCTVYQPLLGLNRKCVNDYDSMSPLADSLPPSSLINSHVHAHTHLLPAYKHCVPYCLPYCLWQKTSYIVQVTVYCNALACLGAAPCLPWLHASTLLLARPCLPWLHDRTLLLGSGALNSKLKIIDLGSRQKCKG
jgi:hypothetical protein